MPDLSTTTQTTIEAVNDTADLLINLPSAIRWHQAIPKQQWLHSSKPFVAVYPNAPLIWLDIQLLNEKYAVTCIDEDTMPHERRYALQSLQNGKAKGLLCTANMLMHPDVIKALPTMRLSALIINQSERFMSSSNGPFDGSRYQRLGKWLGEMPWIANTPLLFTGYWQKDDDIAVFNTIEKIRLNINLSEPLYKEGTFQEAQVVSCFTAHQKLKQLKQIIQASPDSLHIVICRDGFEQKTLYQHLPHAFLLVEALLTNRNQPFEITTSDNEQIVLTTPELLPLLLQHPPNNGYSVTFWQPIWSVQQQTSLLSWLETQSLKQLPVSLKLLYCPDDIQAMRYAWQRKNLKPDAPQGIKQVEKLHNWLKQQVLNNTSEPLSWIDKQKIKWFA